MTTTRIDGVEVITDAGNGTCPVFDYNGSDSLDGQTGNDQLDDGADSDVLTAGTGAGDCRNGATVIATTSSFMTARPAR